MWDTSKNYLSFWIWISKGDNTDCADKTDCYSYEYRIFCTESVHSTRMSSLIIINLWKSLYANAIGV